MKPPIFLARTSMQTGLQRGAPRIATVGFLDFSMGYASPPTHCRPMHPARRPTSPRPDPARCCRAGQGAGDGRPLSSQRPPVVSGRDRPATPLPADPSHACAPLPAMRAGPVEVSPGPALGDGERRKTVACRLCASPAQDQNRRRTAGTETRHGAERVPLQTASALFAYCRPIAFRRAWTGAAARATALDHMAEKSIAAGAGATTGA